MKTSCHSLQHLIQLTFIYSTIKSSVNCLKNNSGFHNINLIKSKHQHLRKHLTKAEYGEIFHVCLTVVIKHVNAELSLDKLSLHLQKRSNYI